MNHQTPAMQAVYTSLREGNDTGDKIRADTGLPHTSVYMALVSLEAKGAATLMCSRGHGCSLTVEWAAL